MIWKRLAKRAAAGMLLAVLLTVQTVAGMPVSVAAAETSAGVADHYYGDQILELTDLRSSERTDAKAIYDALAALTAENRTITVELPAGFSFNTSTRELTAAQSARLETYIKRIGQTAIDAYEYDNPETFWIDLDTTRYDYTYRFVSSGSGYIVSVTSVTVTAGVLEAYQTSLTRYVNRFTAAVSAAEADETSRYTIVKSIHDALVKKNVYDLTGAYAHEAYGGLVDGRSVCEGYAEAFKVLCDKYGVPCVLVSGSATDGKKTESHMWNCVQMEDGKWYGVDVTWDDQGEKGTYYDFMLTGANTAATHFGNLKFANSHQSDGDFNDTQTAVFTYPTLSKTAYKNGGNTGVFYGDVDENGAIEAADALLILQRVVNLKSLSGSRITAADVDKSGDVSAADALLVLQYVVGLIQVFPAQQG